MKVSHYDKVGPGVALALTCSCTIDRSGWQALKDLSRSTSVGTRKIVNYA